MAELASASIGFYIVVDIVKDVGNQAHRLFVARSTAKGHLMRLRRTELDVAYWISHTECILNHAGTIPEQRLQAITANASEFKDAVQKYEKKVKKWCGHLRIPIENQDENLTEGTPALQLSPKESILSIDESSPLEIDEKNHHARNDSRSLSILGRIGFVLYGEHLIREQARRVAELQQMLSIKCVAESRSATSIPVMPSNPTGKRESKLMQFVTQALERARAEAPIRVYRIHVPDAQYEYTDGSLLDVRTEDHPIPEYALPRASLVPLPHAEEQRLEPIEHCIVIRRSPFVALFEEHYESEALKIARLFAEDEDHRKSFLVDRSDSDVLRCCGMVTYPGQGCDLLFRLPPGGNPYPRTLRQVLTDPQSSTPLHPLSDRIRFCIRLVSGLLIVHSLGLVHKRVHPETIVVVEPLAMAETDVFPYKLGHPYLTSLQLARTDDGRTKKMKYQEAIFHRGVYIHPRDQYVEPRPGQGVPEKRLDEYRQRDDIFSAGVCLFEVMCFRSLLIWKEKPEVRFNDYVHDDTFVPLSDNQKAWKDLTPGERAKRKAAVLIEHVKEKIPKALGRRVGKRAAEVVVSFLRAGYEDEAFGVSLKDKSEAEASLFFLSQALRCLREIYRELLKFEKRKRRSRRTG